MVFPNIHPTTSTATLGGGLCLLHTYAAYIPLQCILCLSVPISTSSTEHELLEGNKIQVNTNAEINPN